MKEEKREKLERYRHLNKMVLQGQILFVGSSLMEQFPIYEFLLNRKLPYIIYNRGIGGFTTQELLESLDVCIYDLRPSKIFINIGTNDLNSADYVEESLIRRYRQILEKIREHLPKVKLYLMAYYPVNPEAAAGVQYLEAMMRHRTNKRIASANTAIQRLAEEFNAVYIDCNEGITDCKGQLKAEYTVEGLHMYGDGYLPVHEALLPYLSE